MLNSGGGSTGYVGLTTGGLQTAGAAGGNYYPGFPTPRACPTCGHCPTCGRVTHPVPHVPYPAWYATGAGSAGGALSAQASA